MKIQIPLVEKLLTVFQSRQHVYNFPTGEEIIERFSENRSSFPLPYWAQLLDPVFLDVGS